MMMPTKRILITEYKRKKLKNVKSVKPHYRLIHKRTNTLDPMKMEMYGKFFDDHPNMVYSVMNLWVLWKNHRRTITKYLLALEKQKKVERVIRNNKVYWKKKTQNPPDTAVKS